MLVASEWIVPAAGGAERIALERAGTLAARGHAVRLLCVEGPPLAEAMPIPGGVGVTTLPAPDGVFVHTRQAPAKRDGYWAGKRALRELMAGATRAELARRPADVVVGNLHAAPAVLREASAAGAAGVLVLTSYESLCRNAFDPTFACSPARDCRSCPDAQRLTATERAELLRSREEHADALARADAVVVDSPAVARVVRDWSGRTPDVVAPVTAAPPAAGARFDGHVLLAARAWNRSKGSALLPAVCAAARAAGREVRVTRRGVTRTGREHLAALGVRLVDNAPVAELMRGACAVLVPSQVPESFARIAWESLAAGVPVVASRAGGIADYVPDDRLVAPWDDPRAWERAIAALLGEERAWARAAVQARAAAAEVVAHSPADAFERLLVDTVRRCR